MDDTYQVYVNRVARMTLSETYRTQVQHLQSSPKYQMNPDGTASPVPFPGYSVTTPPWEDEPANSDFYQRVQQCQEQLMQQLPPGLAVFVPPSSFHITLADLIWDSTFRHASAEPDFESKLRDRIRESFHMCQAQVQGQIPMAWQVMGLIMRTRAIALCLVPKTESTYSRVVTLRRAIYQNSGLIALGIEQQYHFTAHITLAYFQDIGALQSPDQVCQIMNDLNQQWQDADPSPEMQMYRAELRKFDDMTRYYREPDWPLVDF